MKTDPLKEAWTDFAAKYPFAVRADLTLRVARWVKNKDNRVCRWVRLNDYRASENNRIFLDRLNKRVYGNAYKRYGKRLNAMLVIEGDELKRPHVHAIFECPDWMSTADLMKLINESWCAAPWSYDERRIEDVETVYGSVGYNVKTGVDAIDLENTNIF